MEQNGWGPPAVDLNFLKSGLGVLKLVQMVLSLAGFIIAEVTASPYNWEQMKAFEWISLTIFVLTLAVFTTFLASWHKSEAVVRVNWPLVDFCHSALCTVLWSINLILGLVSISWYYYPTREGGAIAGTDFCHSALCTVLWSINLILALVITSDYGPGDLLGAIIATVRSWETPTLQAEGFCHSALCTVLWSINLILGLISISWYWLPQEPGAIVDTDFVHSGLCFLLWAVNFILMMTAMPLRHWRWYRVGGTLPCMVLAIISLVMFWATVRMSYRRWHLFSPTPTIPYHYQHLGTEPYS